MSRNKSKYYKKLNAKRQEDRNDEELDAKNAFNISDPVPRLAVQRMHHPGREYSFVQSSLRGA